MIILQELFYDYLHDYLQPYFDDPDTKLFKRILARETDRNKEFDTLKSKELKNLTNLSTDELRKKFNAIITKYKDGKEPSRWDKAFLIWIDNELKERKDGRHDGRVTKNIEKTNYSPWIRGLLLSTLGGYAGFKVAKNLYKPNNKSTSYY